MDAGLGENIRDWHKGRPDDPEHMLDAVDLQGFDKGFFGGHAHGLCSFKTFGRF